MAPMPMATKHAPIFDTHRFMPPRYDSKAVIPNFGAVVSDDLYDFYEDPYINRNNVEASVVVGW